MESNRGLSQGGQTAGRSLEIPPGARVVIVHEQRPTTTATTVEETAAAAVEG